MLNRLTVLILIVFTYFTLFVLSYPPSINASQLFFDDFQLDSTNWSVVNGNWDRYLIDENYWYGTTYNTCCVETVAGNLLWENYVVELDMLGKQGVDKNVIFRYNDRNLKYGIHLTNKTISLEKHTPSTSVDLTITDAYFSNNIVYKVRIEANSNRIKIYVDNNLYIDYTDNDSPILKGKIGLRVGAGAVSPSEVWFDNIKVTEIINPTDTPLPSESASPSVTATAIATATATSTATATPTETATSTPTSVAATATATSTATPINLSVPSLKQYSIPWNKKIYDHTKTTIQEFGCALTSAVMVLQYHGHNVLPDTLNRWLINEKDGYVRNGLVNWLAITRYTKLHDSKKSPSLEYKRLEPTLLNLDNELQNNRPAILNVPGHFIVATGKTEDSYTINDPGYADRNLLSEYNNSFLVLNSYTPTHTDLSYMMYVIDSDMELKIKNRLGTLMETTSYIDTPIISILDPNKKSGESLKTVLFEKPDDGFYTIEITGPKGKYNLDSYLYNENGEVFFKKFVGKIVKNETDTIAVNYKGKIHNRNKDDYKFKWWHKFLNWF